MRVLYFGTRSGVRGECVRYAMLANEALQPPPISGSPELARSNLLCMSHCRKIRSTGDSVPGESVSVGNLIASFH